jgi:leader peptidase (prepilin peptidase)/N-methyltransferase
VQEALPDSFYLFVTAIAGMALGSFATALSWRIPRDISIAEKRRSACPSCGHDLGVADLVPLLSWVFLRGRCRHCKVAIGKRYPLIELSTLGLCLAFYFSFGVSFLTAALVLLAPVIVSIIDIDLHHKIIPDSLNLSVLLLGVAAMFALAVDAGSLSFLVDHAPGAVLGAAVFGLFAFLLRRFFSGVLGQEAMGLGDVKFFTAAGFWLSSSLEALAWFLMFSGFFGVACAVIWKAATGEREFPFGPSLALALIAVLLWQGPFSAILF